MRYSATLSSLATSLLALLVITATATAAAEPSPTEADREQARSLLEEGIQAIRAGEYHTAQRALSRALELLPTYDIAIALGQAELKLGRHVDAARHFQFALNQFPSSESRKLKQSVVEYLGRAKEHVATLQITTLPQGAHANILIDGKPVQHTTGAPQFLEPGSHVIEASLDGDAAGPQTVVVGAGEERTITLELKPRVAAAEQPSAEPPTSPEFDGVTAVPGPSEPSKSLIPVYVGAGITAVGLGTWIGFGVAAGNAKQDARELRNDLGPDGCSTPNSSPERCQQASDTLDRQQRYATLGNVGLGVTFVGGIATLGYLFLWPNRSEKPPTGFMPRLVVGEHASFLELSGGF